MITTIIAITIAIPLGSIDVNIRVTIRYSRTVMMSVGSIFDCGCYDCTIQFTCIIIINIIMITAGMVHHGDIIHIIIIIIIIIIIEWMMMMIHTTIVVITLLIGMTLASDVRRHVVVVVCLVRLWHQTTNTHDPIFSLSLSLSISAISVALSNYL
jgi:hypothetical protein